jgi:hypothetical protein
MITLVKVLLAVFLFLCVLDMPYGYYQFVRFLAMMAFALLAYHEFNRNNQSAAFLFIGLAILFQPLIKLALGRELWNIVDVVVGLGLIVSIFIKPSRIETKT